MSHQPTLPGIPKRTGSRVSADGRSHSGSRDGPSPGPYGPDRALASRTPRQALEAGTTTRAHYGGRGDGSLISADLSPSLASRLRARLDVNGSPEYALTWTYWDMPSGPPIYRLRASARRTSDSGCGGWPTPMKVDADGGPRQQDGRRGAMLREAVSGWATPTTRDWKSGGANLSQSLYRKDGKMRNDLLDYQAAIAGWQSPTAGDARSRTYQYDQHDKTRPRLSNEGCLSGAPQIGFPAPTEKRGALNPELSRWLQGYPDTWTRSAPTETPSSRRSRQNS